MAGIQGEDGELRWGYQLAGVMNFTITQDPGPPRVMVVHGRLVRSDPFTLSQRPLVFIWPLASKRWQYPIASIEITQDHVTARLGPRQDG